MTHLDGRPGRRERWAFLAPLLILWAMTAVELDRSTLPYAAVLSLSFFAGAAAGTVWQILYRRDFVERFVPWAVVFVVASLLGLIVGLGLVPGITVNRSSAWLSLAPQGVVAGLVLTEAWLRLRRGPLIDNADGDTRTASQV